MIHDFFSGIMLSRHLGCLKYYQRFGTSQKLILRELDGFNIEEIPAPPPLVFSLAFQDGGSDQCTSQFPALQATCCGLVESNWNNLPTEKSDLAWALYSNYIPEVNAKSRSFP